MMERTVAGSTRSDWRSHTTAEKAWNKAWAVAFPKDEQGTVFNLMLVTGLLNLLKNH